ncbi:MAG: MarR family winged helix-turn-helix transcriptional regulator [Phenylobacterium sp.]
MSTTSPTLRDYPRTQGGAAIGARLRRLSERIDREADQVYRQLGIEFEQRWFGLLNVLAMSGPLSVGEIAETLGITHAAVSQTRASLQARGLVAADADPTDARRRALRLTADGEALVARLRPTWEALNEVARELNREAGDAVETLGRLEAALDRRGLLDRLRDLPDPEAA